MKEHVTPLLLILVCTSLYSYSQTQPGEYVPNTPATNSANNPCITPQDYEILNMECAENIKKFKLDKKTLATLSTSVNWPIKAATGFTDCDFYFIGAYVDQNTVTVTYQDYDCGTNTYDGHHGTDIAVWPFGFYKMDNSLVEVVAAAGGTIIQKADGNFDRNCSSNNLTANSIIIQHADGSQALYWHMKKNSLTSKTVSQTVVAGEYLGVAGSSGSSSGPHLHFEVWTGSTNTTYNDPFSGTCNIINATSWWNVQKPHTNPAVIKVSANTTDIVLPGCPTTETPNEADTFAIPFQGAGLAPGYAKFYIFIRDDVSGLVADCKILNPNGSTFNSWQYTSSTSTKTAIKGYSKLLPTIPGTYTFQATYNGNTCAKSFVITTATGISHSDNLTQLQLSPNPASGTLCLSGTGLENGVYNLRIENMLGQTRLTEQVEIENNGINKKIGISDLPEGSYFLTVQNDRSRVVKKIIKISK